MKKFWRFADKLAEPFSSRSYMRELRFPFCPGCGLFSLADTFLRAVHELGHEDLKEFCFASGIGCSSWIPSPYFAADSVHTLHGRSIPVAMGIKLTCPELNVVVFGGDGDIVGIGLSHFIHAARRNADMLVLMGNNRVYGMTGGQVAPTTPAGTVTATTPYGSFEQPIDAAQLAVASGAAYSARWTTAHLPQLKESIKKAIEMQGFRFIEILTHCHTAYGRKAGFRNVRDILDHFRENAVSIRQAREIRQNLRKSAIIVGEFVEKERPTLVEAVYSIMKKAKKNVGQN